MTHLDVVGAILIYEGRILCMQRPRGMNEATSLKFEFPGGKIDPGEKRTEALHRELNEELGLDAEVLEENFYMTVNHTYPGFEITMYVFKCYLASPHFELREHVGYSWLYPSDLTSLNWAPADQYVVAKLKDELSL